MRRKDKRVYWLWLSHACGQGSACAVELVRNFGDAEAVFDADADELDSCGVKIEKRTMSKLCLKDTEEKRTRKYLNGATISACACFIQGVTAIPRGFCR